MRLTPIRRAAVLAFASAAVLGSTGCFGSFNLTRKLYGFNKSASDDKVVRELVFLGLNIIPVYSAASFIDAVVLNTVEFWTGTNPVQMSSTMRLDSATTVRKSVVADDSLRTMTLQTYEHDSLVATTTVQYVTGTHHMTFATNFPDGSSETHVVAMTPEGKPFVSAETFTDLVRRGVSVEY